MVRTAVEGITPAPLALPSARPDRADPLAASQWGDAMIAHTLSCRAGHPSGLLPMFPAGLEAVSKDLPTVE